MPSGIPFDANEINKKKRKILDAMRDGFNMTLTEACLIVKVNRTTVYEWMAADTDFKASVDEARKASLNNGLDLAEKNLMKKINEEDRRSIFYFLDRKGGDRGYNPKIIADGTGFNVVNNSLMIQGVNPSQLIVSDADTDSE